MLDADPLAVITGEVDHRPELPILLDLLAEAEERAGAPVLRALGAREGPRGVPLRAAAARDFAGFEDALADLGRARLHPARACASRRRRVRALLARPDAREVAPADRAVAVDDHAGDLEDHALHRRGGEDLRPTAVSSVVRLGRVLVVDLRPTRSRTAACREAREDAEEIPNGL